MNSRAVQSNFSKGEIGPQLYGRFDVDAWRSAVEQARNVVVLKYGGLAKRPGTKLVAEVLDDSAPTRLIPFEFSLTQTYALEFGQGYAAPLAQGGRVVEEQLLITSISAAPNAVVSAAFHGYLVGEIVFIQGVLGTMAPVLNNRYWTVTSVPNDGSFGIDANTTGLTFISAAGGIIRVGAPPAPPAPPIVPPPYVEPDPIDTQPGGGGFRPNEENVRED